MSVVFTSPSRDWAMKAACRSVPSELFFPVGTNDAAETDRSAAKAICARCEVARPCLEYALATRQEFGIWGGLDEDQLQERRRMLRRAGRGAQQDELVPLPAR